MKNNKIISTKELSRDEWITAQQLVASILSIDAYFCKRNPEDTESDSNVLRNIAIEVEKKTSVMQRENMLLFMSFTKDRELRI